jgi:hypothetical protein
MAIQKITLKSKRLGELSRFTCSKCEGSLEVHLHLSDWHPDDTQGTLREDFPIQHCWKCGAKFTHFAARDATREDGVLCDRTNWRAIRWSVGHPHNVELPRHSESAEVFQAVHLRQAYGVSATILSIF